MDNKKEKRLSLLFSKCYFFFDTSDMSTFVVFTYQFSPIIDDTPSLFKDDIDPLQSMEKKNQILDELVNDEQLIISYLST